MWRYHQIAQIYRLFFQHKIISNEVYENIEHRIATTACQIAEGLLVYPAAKGLVKKINDTQNDISRATQQISTMKLQK